MEKCTETVIVMLTPTQKMKLKRHAAAGYMTMSEAIRRMIELAPDTEKKGRRRPGHEK